MCEEEEEENAGGSVVHFLCIGLYVFMQGFDMMKPRRPTSAPPVWLLVTLLFLDSQETSAQRSIPHRPAGDINDSFLTLIRNSLYFRHQLFFCLFCFSFAVSLISTAASSARDGELGVKHRQRRAGAAVG